MNHHHPLRDPGPELERQRRQLVNQRMGEIEALPSWVDGMEGRRAARTSAGVVATLGVVAMIALGLFELNTGWPRNGALLDVAIPGIWAAIVAMMAAVHLFYRALPTVRQRMTAELEPSGDPVTDLERARETVPQRLARHLGPVPARSAWWPAVGLSLIGPLSVHLVVYGLINGSLQEFGGWIAISGAIVPHAHLVFAWIAGRRSAEVFAGERKSMYDTIAGPVGWATLAAAFPGAVLMLLPPGLTLVTGLIVALALFAVLFRAARRERALAALMVG